MDKKTKVIVTLILLSAIALCTVIANPLRRSEAHITNKLLKAAPLGTSMNEVSYYIKKHKNWKTIITSYEHGFHDQRDYEGKTVGSKHIRVSMGDYIPLSPLPFTTNVTAFWGFDDDYKLIDIWVWKTVDAP